MAHRPRRSGRLAVEAAWLAALLAAAWLTPRLVEAYGALQWTRFHASRVAGPRPGDHARRAAHAAARVIDLAAPLPWAREAAGLALDASRQLEAPNKPSAVAAYEEVRGALDRAGASPIRRIGLGDLAREPEPRPSP